MSMIVQGMYDPSPTPTITKGKYLRLRTDQTGTLLTKSSPSPIEAHNNVAGSGSTTGKIGTVANAAILYVALDCSDFPVSGIDWAITSDQQFTYQLFRSHQNEISGTLTLADAKVLEANDTLKINELTFTAKATADASLADRYFDLGASNAEAAVNLAAMLADDTYGVPGLNSATSVPTAATDVITLVSGSNTTLQFGQGTSDADEIVWSDATRASLWTHAVAVASNAATTGTRGIVVNQSNMNGWEWGFIALTNTSGGAAATFEVRAMRY